MPHWDGRDGSPETLWREQSKNWVFVPARDMQINRVVLMSRGEAQIPERVHSAEKLSCYSSGDHTYSAAGVMATGTSEHLTS